MLLGVRCLLFVVCCEPTVMCNVLCVVGRVLFAVCCLLCVACGLLSVVVCCLLLLVVRCLLFVAGRMWSGVCC